MSTQVTEFPKLYKKTSTGAQQEWSIWVVGNEIHSAWGQTDGAKQKTVDVVKTGKNVGKRNATTPEQQAEAEALSQWEKKLKRGYNQTADAAMAGEVDACIEGGIAPMLAHSYADHGHKITWPAYVQNKYDGHRMIAVVQDSKCTLWSRTRKPITGLPHIVSAVEALCRAARRTHLVLDGEAYNHNYRDKFEELTSFIRQKTPKDGHEVVEYHVYDIVTETPSLGFRSRFDILRSLPFKLPLVLAETVEVRDAAELATLHESAVLLGYEGVMIRNAAGEYMHKRSCNLLKVKLMQDAEFEIVNVQEGRGKLAGHAIFTCQTRVPLDGGATTIRFFNAKLMGKTSELKKYWADPSLAIGRKLTVKYQSLTADGIPRFPVGVRLREDV